ncbi:MAG: hypothetical protein L0241_25205 [Planctomycetia bacterium]|nr:hypothetical protein [Planctomycetia bacterium]
MSRLAAFAFAALFSAGCMHDGEWSVRRALGLDGGFPRAKNVPAAQFATAERVETLGRKIIAQNTFTGIEPLFHTIGVKESVLFHRGTEELFISEGLVAKCKTDGELAALLCAELGQMMAEKRAAKAVGRDTDPIPDTGFGGGPLFPGGSAYDAGRQAELGYHEKKYPRGANHLEAADAAKLSRELLKGAGFDPTEMDKVEPLLKQSDRGEKLRKQFGGTGALPKWEK